MDSFRLVGADGHGYAGHLRDELLDEALAVLVGADEVPEGLSTVDEDAGPVEVALRLFEVGVEHGVFFLQQPDHLVPLGEGVDPLCRHPARLVEGGVCRMLGAGLHRGRGRFFCRRGRSRFGLGRRCRPGRFIPGQRGSVLHRRFLRKRRQVVLGGGRFDQRFRLRFRVCHGGRRGRLQRGLCYRCGGLHSRSCRGHRNAHKGLRRGRCRKGAGRFLRGRRAGCGFHRCPLHHLGRLGQAEEGKLQLNALVAAAGHVFEGVAQGADGPDGLLLAQLRPFFEVAGLFLRRHTGEQCLPAGQRRQHEGAVMGDEFFGQALHIHRLLPQLGQLSQRGGSVLRRDGVRDAEQIAPVGDACHPADHVGVHFGGHACTGVQNGQRIAHGTIGQPGDQLRALGGQLQPLLPGNILHPLGDILRPDAGEVVPLAAGQDGGRDFLDLGRRQDEDDMGGRLFQRFQQRVERRC